MTVSKQCLQSSYLNAQVPQQKLPTRLHNNICLLAIGNAGLSFDDLSNLPPSHNDLANLGSTINDLPFPVYRAYISTIAAHQGYTASARSTGTGLAWARLLGRSSRIHDMTQLLQVLTPQIV